MFTSFRLSMSWLHTWFGLFMGCVLMVMFLFGTLSVFDREIDRWAMPATRFAAQPMPSFEAVLEPAFRRITKPDPAEMRRAKSLMRGPLPPELPLVVWVASTTHRDPILRLFAGFSVPGSSDPDQLFFGQLTIDPRDGSVLPKSQLPIGTDFFYPMHTTLHLDWQDLGVWIVGLAAVTMLSTLVSGIAIHKRLFRELFTFRPKRHLKRSVLDVHNLTGVVALPFLFFISLSGLIIAIDVYFPTVETMMKPLVAAQAHIESLSTGLAPRPSGVHSDERSSIDAMMKQASARWAARGVPGTVGEVLVMNVNDAASYVRIERTTTDRVATREAVSFQASTGRLLQEEASTPPVASVNGFLTGLHLQRFEHWLLRWMMFAGGVAGCVCIATGFVFFVEKRRRRHAQHGLAGVRWADAAAVTAVTGPLCATLGMMVANRLIPEQWPGADTWQKSIFWIVWLMALAHASWRSRRSTRLCPAWTEQTLVITALALSAVMLNWITTGATLVRTIGEGEWAVAGVDLMLLVTATIAGLAGRRLYGHTHAATIHFGQDPMSDVVGPNRA